MNVYVLLGAWLIVLVALGIVSAQRTRLGHSEDDHLHVSDFDASAITTQNTIAHKLDVLDRWKTLLIAVSVLLGLIIAVQQAYVAWIQGSRLD